MAGSILDEWHMGATVCDPLGPPRRGEPAKATIPPSIAASRPLAASSGAQGDVEAAAEDDLGG